jgi:hypothetical protein
MDVQLQAALLLPRNGQAAARENSPLFETALVLMRFDYIASIIVNVDHRVV